MNTFLDMPYDFKINLPSVIYIWLMYIQYLVIQELAELAEV